MVSIIAMNWWAILSYSSHACAQISCWDDVIYTECHGLCLGLPTAHISRDVPYFGDCVPNPGLGLPGTQNVPYFRKAKLKFFGCDATPIHIKFHPETLKLMCMGRQQPIWRCVNVTMWSVKVNCQAWKIASRMHYNTLFQERNLKIFLGRG